MGKAKNFLAKTWEDIRPNVLWDIIKLLLSIYLAWITPRLADILKWMNNTETIYALIIYGAMVVVFWAVISGTTKVFFRVFGRNKLIKENDQARQISKNIISGYHDMPSISRNPPLRVTVENKNSQPIICKVILRNALSQDERIKKYLSNSNFFWIGNSQTLVMERKIDTNTFGTFLLADIDKENPKDESMYFVTQEEINKYVKRFRKLGKYRIVYEIQGFIEQVQFTPIRIDHTFEVVLSPKTKKRFIRTTRFETEI
jgi:hypothetical protein